MQDFKKWTEKFLEAFGSTTRISSLLREIQQCVQRRGETLSNFAYRLEAMTKQANFAFMDTKDEILRGLLPEYRVIVHEVRGRSHSSVAELVRDVNDAMNFHRLLPGGVKERYEMDGNEGSRKDVVCFNCHQRGHLKKSCPTRANAPYWSSYPRGAEHQSGLGNGAGDQLGGHAGTSGNSGGGEVPQSAPRATTVPQGRAAMVGDASSHGGPQSANSGNKSKQQSPSRVICYRCQATGHVARNCKQVLAAAEDSDLEHSQEEEEQHDEEQGSSALEDNETSADETKVVLVNGVECHARIATQADVSLVARSTAERLKLEMRPPAIKRLRGVGGVSEVLGECEVRLTVDGIEHAGVVISVLEDSAVCGRAMLVGKDVLNREGVIGYREGISRVTQQAETYATSRHPFTANLSRWESVSLSPHSPSPVIASPLAQHETAQQPPVTTTLLQSQPGVGTLHFHTIAELLPSSGFVTIQGRLVKVFALKQFKSSEGMKNIWSAVVSDGTGRIRIVAFDTFASKAQDKIILGEVRTIHTHRHTLHDIPQPDGTETAYIRIHK